MKLEDEGRFARARDERATKRIISPSYDDYSGKHSTPHSIHNVDAILTIHRMPFHDG
jgi:hypothetical protein